MFAEVEVPLLAANVRRDQCIAHRRDDRDLFRFRGDNHLGCQLRHYGAQRDTNRTAGAQLPGNDPAYGDPVRRLYGSIPGCLRCRARKRAIRSRLKIGTIAYIISVLGVILLFEFLPYVEEFLRACAPGQLVPPQLAMRGDRRRCADRWPGSAE
jgi:hypothetical protein